MNLFKKLEFTTRTGLDALRKIVVPDAPIAVDIEMFGLQNRRLHHPEGRFASMSFSATPDKAVVITETSEIQPAMNLIRESSVWILQNGQFDLTHLRRWANIPSHPVWDTMLMDRGLFGGYHKNFSLDALSARWLNHYMDKSIRDRFASGTIMDNIMIHYSAEDAVVTLMVAKKQADYMRQHSMDRFLQRYWKLDGPMVWAVMDMPDVLVNVDVWTDLATKFQERGETLQSELGLNVNSYKVVKARLAELLNTTVDSIGSTGADAMNNYIAMNGGPTTEVGKFCTDVLRARSLRKMASTYGKKWVKSYVQEDNTVKAYWKISQAVTGRMSCADPNLQNIPARDPEFAEYRTAFIAPKGMRMMVADVSQQEPRITAYLSKDPNMLKIFRENKDFHSSVAVLALGADESEMHHGHPLRKRAKEIGLGLAYNLSIGALAAKLDIPYEQAKLIYQAYHSGFSGIGILQQQYTAKAMSLGYTETSMGKRCYVSPNSNNVTGDSINYAVQGTAAEQMKLACAYLHSRCSELGKPYPVVLVVHDEMVLQVPTEEVEEFRGLITEAWEYAGNETIPGVPIVMEIGVGNDWSAKE